MSPTKRVAVLHPDLGIGGAERLIVDVCMALEGSSNVNVYTSHYDTNHCFEETRKLSVTVVGDWLPISIFNKFYILCAFIRQLWLVIWLIWSGILKRQDLIILDQLSYCIPLINYFKNENCKVLFYCHFPDQLLANHEGLIRNIYRKLFDFVEEWSTGKADCIVVNSKFTKSIVEKTFKSLNDEELKVVYPCVHLDNGDDNSSIASPFIQNDASFFLSINRFERKKGIDLAIRSYHKFIGDNQVTKSTPRLIIAGGYDIRVNENIQYLQELKQICEKFDLPFQTVTDDIKLSTDMEALVFFMPNIKSQVKDSLLKFANALLYTPRYEHFGIVPIEAMKLGTLVIADTSGGPLETIKNYYIDPKANWTGFNVDINDEEQWAETLKLVISLKNESVSENCKERVSNLFSFKAMRQNLYTVISSLD
ncbi:GDP-Man:Man(1)GlcNAc(2)-PP-dolichol alpha-1,3-mannosyltransferase [Martiniozyma asiatica (nom. inval.)]|nr:GDP-Man:Man(1)GlcNAc(2)-PP-dolichol alpha-1,3-mannosyltransferase [Martiniozyma asiatica]